MPNQQDDLLRPDDVERLLDIGAALSAERNLDRLLERLLDSCRRISTADAGSLFLAEGPAPDQPTHLRFKLAQNDSIEVNLSEFSIPLSSQSLVGYVAESRRPIRINDVYELGEEYPFRFNREVDQRTGYRSMSLLSVPMTDRMDQLIGVIQLWNKKRNRDAKLRPDTVAHEVIPFHELDDRLLRSLAAQAGIAIENARLYTEIEKLFEGFIHASVTAIESRDPTTSGHSERVAVLSVELAEAVHRTDRGVYSNVLFSERDLRELRYAAVLHDFGKIGVREAVLVKAKKLYPLELESIRDRFDLLYRSMELEAADKKIEYLAKGGKSGDKGWLSLCEKEKVQLDRLKEAYHLVLSSNEPSVLPEAVSDKLKELSSLTVARPDGSKSQLLSSEQTDRLTIPKGSLSAKERHEIEAHVTHTYAYLKRIPWTRELRNVPEIAYAHHEKLDGTGYPLGTPAPKIPLPSRIMTVADIFDALAARDRPYKRAVPVPKALDILRAEAREGKLDTELVQLFIDAQIFSKTTSSK